jgi:putative radical SAM enzyme (TIGR03279 family)
VNNAYVSKVDKNSIASEVAITSGDLILSINHKEITDIFDYKYLIVDEYLLLEVQKEDGEIWEIEIEKDEDEELGINFLHDLIDCEKSCNNKCIFCFIDQLPKGMRETLYFKDDDSRLSFLTGNYATLTNMDQKALERIARLRLSPINISVHTTNKALRIEMLKNKFAGEVLHQIEYLASQNIEMNTQVVLCKGINDGKELERTISDLRVFYPHIKSLSVVPVGVSKYREGLYPLSPFNKSDSQ